MVALPLQLETLFLFLVHILARVVSGRMHPVRVPVVTLSVAAVRLLPGGVWGEDGLHRLGPALSVSGQRPVHAYW